jgi:hypothetical protein
MAIVGEFGGQLLENEVHDYKVYGCRTDEN